MRLTVCPLPFPFPRYVLPFLLLLFAFCLAVLLTLVIPVPTHGNSTNSTVVVPSPTLAPTPTPSPVLLPPAQVNCFPGLSFQMPSNIPDSLDNWWCPMHTDYAFMGFSYEITACQSIDQLNAEFSDIRNKFRGRYVRLYGVCDNDGFYNNIVNAAWNNSLGVHALIWFDFNSDDMWETRRDSLINTLTTNPVAKFVTRGVQFGSEPLYDNAISHTDLAAQVMSTKARLAGVQIPVTVSELAYGYQMRGGAQDVLDAIDYINIHMLPFFTPHATTGTYAWPLIVTDMDWFIQHGDGKKMYLDENGWPSATSSSVQPNGPDAVASIRSEQEYYEMLDSHCRDFGTAPGGIGWFAHIYSDHQEVGYGIYDVNGTQKFPFQPRTSC